MRLPRPHFTMPVSRRGRLALGLVVGGLLLALGCGAYAWYRHGVYVASPGGAVDRLNLALAQQDLALFADTVDAGSLAAAFARDLAAVVPGTDETRTADLVQLAMLAMLRDEEPPRALRKATVPILPEAPRLQLTQVPFSLEDGPTPTAASTVHLSAWGELPVRLALVRTGDVWRVNRVLNAPGLIRRYLDQVEALHRQQREAKIRRNEENRAALVRLLPNPQCSGGVTRISGNVPLLGLSMNSGPNPGPETVEAWGATLVLSAADGRIMARPRVTLTSKIQPGSGVTGAWSQDIDETEYRRLEQAGPLTCSAALDYAILTSGTVYKVTPEEE